MERTKKTAYVFQERLLEKLFFFNVGLMAENLRLLSTFTHHTLPLLRTEAVAVWIYVLIESLMLYTLKRAGYILKQGIKLLIHLNMKPDMGGC